MCPAPVPDFAPVSAADLDLMGFSSLFDAYQCVTQDRDAVASDVAALVAEAGADLVLDCAAGTGLPAIDLRASGMELTCSDGDPDMVVQFQRNAKWRGVDGQCDVRCWSQLPDEGRRYDYVLCRGNSLVYAATWRGGDQAAPASILGSHLAAFRDVLVPGGTLQVDVPRRLGLPRCDGSIEASATTRLHETEYEGELHRIAVSEEVVEERRSRRWRVRLEITAADGITVVTGFERHSSRLTVDDLIPLLGRAGFVDVRERSLASDRPYHVTVLATRPG